MFTKRNKIYIIDKKNNKIWSKLWPVSLAYLNIYCLARDQACNTCNDQKGEILNILYDLGMVTSTNEIALKYKNNEIARMGMVKCNIIWGERGIYMYEWS